MTLSTTARTIQAVSGNSRSLKSAQGLGEIGLLVPSLTEVIVGFGFQYDSYSGANNIVFVGGSSPWNTAQGVMLSVNGGTGVLTAYINSGGGAGTVLGTATGTYSPSTWYYVELRVKLGTSTGEVEVKINGGSVLNLTSVNTATGSLTYYSNIAFRCSSSSTGAYFDDLYVCDKTGSTNNNFLGPVSVYTLMPTGAGSTTNLTAVGAASNWQAVSEIAVDTTTYVETSTNGNKDYYGFEDLPAGISTVFGVVARIRSMTPDNGGRKVRLNMKNGASVISSALRTLTMSSWLSDFFLSETAPDGSAWTKTSVDATEAGPEAG